MRVLRKFQSSDGRIKIGTLSGVSVVVAVIALLVGVLPVMADHDPPGSGPLVSPVTVNYGGGSGACSATLTDGDGNPRLPSAASKEFHINNPQPGATYTQDGITVQDIEDRTTLPAGRVFDFSVIGDVDFVVYDVIVNGGAQNNHYDYDREIGAVDHDNNLHAPRKNNRSLYNLSHINICYDVPGLTFFACDTTVPLTEQSGLFRIAEATIFANSENLTCTDKRGSFLIDNTGTDPNVKLDFGTGEGFVTGRLDVTKVFEDENGDPDPASFEPLEYSVDAPGGAVDLDWCSLRSKVAGDGDQFDDVLDPNDDLAPAETQYPSTEGAQALIDGNVACKVAEFEDATGRQFTVVYFEFVDPRFY